MQSDSHRLLHKSSSFLSLRREASTKAVNTNSSPSSYFDFYPKKSKSRRACQDLPTTTPRVTTVNPATYAFPTFEPIEVLSSAHPPLIHNQYSRTRSRTGPSAKSQWDAISSVPQSRFSGSSSTQHTETPPRTPDDSMATNSFLDHFPVVVAAPVAGVETMDALVDGMNGGDMRSRSSRARFGIPGHHPLYQPPLPTPPPGVVLGGGKARPGPSRLSATSGESSDDNDGYSSLPNPISRTRRRTRRPGSSRTPSNSTITLHRNSQNSGDETISQSSTFRPNVRDFSRSNEYRKSVVPSISEIIRNHAPPESQARSRPSTIRSSSLYSPSTHGHATLHEEVESEPEPLTREEEVELLSRSSIDSVADEVQRTIRNQSLPKPALPPPLTSAFIRRQSILSDNTSLYSPRSDPGASSIYSLSAPSSYISNSPFDTTNFINMAKPTPSQAVAQYLRSARLTTLLKLTRSPHASQDNPLTVSLSDLGCPTGFPVIVFLGLGCVRHIMGLYDEMADCMGLRLITIDR